uniref:BUD13 homolog n=1 Tax=Acrobeloides nanus TaxID=290746 RepID=A0A914BWK9_9BILA
MASVNSSSISKNDYLKKYLSNDKPKKKTKTKPLAKGMKVVEDDAFISVSSKAVRDSEDESSDDNIKKELKAKLKIASAAKFRDDTFEVVEEIIRNPGNQASSSKWKEIKQEVMEKDESPPRRHRRRHDSNSSDQSPVRNKRSPSRSISPTSHKKKARSPIHHRGQKERMKMNEDESPPRRRRRHDSESSDQSPVRRKEELPQRRRSRSPARRDASPYRRRRRYDSGASDQSPVRKDKSKRVSRSPVRNIKKEVKSPSREKDESPVRRRRKRSSGSSDQSPVRKRARSPSSNKIKQEVRSSSPEQKSIASRAKTLDGKRAGLVSANEMREETKWLKEKERRIMDDLDEDLTGRGAETKVRSSAYKKKSSKEDLEKKAREAKKNEELKEKYETWNKGLSQIQGRKEQLVEMERTIKEDFARYADDKAMNEHLKEQLYLEDDPMAQIISKKRQKVRERTTTVYPTYQGSWAPNRFNIQPGYRWDGVDRSNGFEGKMALTDNKRKAQEEHTYRSILECGE